ADTCNKAFGNLSPRAVIGGPFCRLVRVPAAKRACCSLEGKRSELRWPLAHGQYHELSGRRLLKTARAWRCLDIPVERFAGRRRLQSYFFAHAWLAQTSTK